MFDLVSIFTTGGVLLFYKAFCVLKFDVIDSLIKKILIQDKSGEQSYFIDPYKIKWRLANDLNLIFVVVYQEIFQIQYIEDFLELLKDFYIQNIYPEITIDKGLYRVIPNFEKEFVVVYDKWQKKNLAREKKNMIMRSFEDTAKGKEIVKKKSQKEGTNSKKPTQTTQSEKKDDETNEKNVSEKNENDDDEDDIEKNRAKLAQKFAKKGKKEKDNNNKLELNKTKSMENSGKKKEGTQWGTKDIITAKDMKKLDASKVSTNDEDKMIEEEKKKYFLDKDEDLKIKGFYDNDDDISSDEDEEDDKKNITTQKKGIFSKLSDGIKNLTGNKVLTEGDLQVVLSKFKEDLMIKNVAEEIAQKLCNSLKTNLLDKKTKAFTSISKTVKESLRESLTKILTPKKDIDVIREVMKAKEQRKPYVMVFIGVNGVGKSTNLAKVAYLLKNQGFSLLLAACDNFRAGAVEQIKTHGKCLDIPVFDRGYKEEPPEIASYAIKEAIQKKIDVVLIDTAGRMQNNEPLMQALSRLVVLNQPDLILFIGEALVGNDAVDQLSVFNRWLVDLSPKNNVREIDGIILSKFDTVDEKVGAAISMTYTTGKPILFVGVGQKYPHLKKLNVKTVVHALLS